MSELESSFPDRRVVGDWMTIAEAAARVRCCERTIRRAIECGALRAGRIRGARGSKGAVRIRHEDLAAWLFAEDE